MYQRMLLSSWRFKEMLYRKVRCLCSEIIRTYVDLCFHGRKRWDFDFRAGLTVALRGCQYNSMASVIEFLVKQRTGKIWKEAEACLRHSLGIHFGGLMKQLQNPSQHWSVSGWRQNWTYLLLSNECSFTATLIWIWTVIWHLLKFPKI